jgi:hypothetical protein
LTVFSSISLNLPISSDSLTKNGPNPLTNPSVP